MTVAPLQFLIIIWLWEPVSQLTENSRQLNGLNQLILSNYLLLPRDCEESLAGSGNVLVKLAELVDLLDHGWKSEELVASWSQAGVGLEHHMNDFPKFNRVTG